MNKKPCGYFLCVSPRIEGCTFCHYLLFQSFEVMKNGKFGDQEKEDRITSPMLNFDADQAKAVEG